MHVVYVIENSTSGRVYVGSTHRYRRRMSDHFSALRRGAHDNPRLQHEWNKYGTLRMRVFASALRPEFLEALEQQALDQVAGEGRALNIITDVQRPMQGRKHTEEAKAKISSCKKGVRLTPEQKAARAASLADVPNPMQGRKHSPETLAKISEALKKTFADGRTPTRVSPSEEMRLQAAARAREKPMRKDKGKPVRGFKDGEVREWLTTIACAKDIGCDLSYPSQRVNTGKKVKGWTLVYIDNAG